MRRLLGDLGRRSSWALGRAVATGPKEVVWGADVGWYTFGGALLSRMQLSDVL